MTFDRLPRRAPGAGPASPARASAPTPVPASALARPLAPGDLSEWSRSGPLRPNWC